LTDLTTTLGKPVCLAEWEKVLSRCYSYYIIPIMSAYIRLKEET